MALSHHIAVVVMSNRVALSSMETSPLPSAVRYERHGRVGVLAGPDTCASNVKADGQILLCVHGERRRIAPDRASRRNDNF